MSLVVSGPGETRTYIGVHSVPTKVLSSTHVVLIAFYWWDIGGVLTHPARSRKFQTLTMKFCTSSVRSALLRLTDCDIGSHGASAESLG